MLSTTGKTVRTGVIASLYVVLSLVTYPIASGAVQLRISEGLTLLPLIYPESVIGLFVGCFLSNMITGCVIFDTVAGSVITLIAGVFTAVIGKTLKSGVLKVAVGGIFPVLFNAFLLPLVWYVCYGTGEYVYIIQVALLTASQSLSVYLIGVPVFGFAERGKRNGIKILS